MKEKFRQLFTKVSKGYLRKNVDELLNSKPEPAHNTLRKMGARPGEDEDNTVTDLPEFLDSDLTKN